MVTAMFCAAAVTAQFVGGKATRDALFLNTFDVGALPTMLIATCAFSVLLVAAHAFASRRATPATLVPASFAASGVLFVAEWLFRSASPSVAAVVAFLHISGAGPLMASGFWLIASERFNPRTAKKGFGRVTGAGTLGGLAGALVAERVAAIFGVPFMLLALAALQFLTAWLVWRLASGVPAALADRERATLPPATVSEAKSGLRALAHAPSLRNLVVVVLLGTMSAALVDFVFKARAVETFGPGDGLLRFFALYYAATGVIAFLLQTLTSRAVLERFGLGLTTSTPSIALLAGSVGTLIAPGLGSLAVARGSESMFRSSWFRAGYELFFTPMPAAEKRAAKSIVDVAVDRLGEAVGAGLVRLVILLAPAAQSSTILGMAIAGSLGAIVAASRLHRFYIRTLESSLVRQASSVDLSDEMGSGTITVRLDVVRERAALAGLVASAPRQDDAAATADPILQSITALRSGRRDEIVEVLSRPEGLRALLVPHVIPLLAVDALADHALFALRKVAEERVGELTDALLDPNQDYAVKRRLARVFSICVSQRAADGLMLALDDPRFDVRFQTARSLAAMSARNPRLQFAPARIYDVVLQEVAVGEPVWESQRLLDGFVSGSPLDAFVRDRAGQSLAHVFTLLSLVLPREPLQIAFRSLNSDDQHLRGTALEYLEGVLPPSIRQRLWPFLVRRRSRNPTPQREDVIADLLRSSPSITLKDIAARTPFASN